MSLRKIVRNLFLKLAGINIWELQEEIAHNVVKIVLDEKDRLKKEAAEADKHRTICEVIHEAYDGVQQIEDVDLKQKLEENLEEAYYYAKKMNAKLFAYNKNWDKDMWDENIDYKEDLRKRKKLYEKTD